MKTLHKWAAIGALEVLTALVAIALAPGFLNGSKPVVGFLLWASVPTMAIGSGAYVTGRLKDAATSQQLLTRFKDFQALSLVECLEYPSAHVTKIMPLLEAVDKDEQEFERLGFSLQDLLDNKNA